MRKVDQFIKTLAKTKSYSMAKQARTVLSSAFGLAVRFDAMRENPVRDTARIRRPPTQPMSLSLQQVEEIRRAVRGWRREPGLPGPPPDTAGGRAVAPPGRAPLHGAVVALSAHYNAVLAGQITRAFGIEWEHRDRGEHHNAAWELEPGPRVTHR